MDTQIKTDEQMAGQAEGLTDGWMDGQRDVTDIWIDTHCISVFADIYQEAYRTTFMEIIH